MAAGNWHRLVVGGGRASDFPKLKPGDLAMNIDADALPDVQADINAAPFPSSCFEEVYVEKVPYHAFTGMNLNAIKEMVRVLSAGGRLIIETGSHLPIAEVRSAMTAAGLQRIRVTQRGFVRITGRLRE